MRFRAYYSREQDRVIDDAGWIRAVSNALAMADEHTGQLEAVELEESGPTDTAVSRHPS